MPSYSSVCRECRRRIRLTKGRLRRTSGTARLGFDVDADRHGIAGRTTTSVPHSGNRRRVPASWDRRRSPAAAARARARPSPQCSETAHPGTPSARTAPCRWCCAARRIRRTPRRSRRDPSSRRRRNPLARDDASRSEAQAVRDARRARTHVPAAVGRIEERGVRSAVAVVVARRRHVRPAGKPEVDRILRRAVTREDPPPGVEGREVRDVRFPVAVVIAGHRDARRPGPAPLPHGGRARGAQLDIPVVGILAAPEHRQVGPAIAVIVGGHGLVGRLSAPPLDCATAADRRAQRSRRLRMGGKRHSRCGHRHRSPPAPGYPWALRTPGTSGRRPCCCPRRSTRPFLE